MTNSLVRLLPEGGMRVRWRFKPGVRWSDGTPLTMEDVVFSLNTGQNPLRTAVEIVDARTIDLTYSQRRQEFLATFSLYQRAALEPVFRDGGRDVLGRASTGLGVPTMAAYRIKSFTADKSMVLERNPNFPGPAPVFEQVEVVKVAAASAVEALLSRQVDVLPAVDGKDYGALRSDERVRVLEQPGELLYVLVPNLDRAPWNNLAARRALLSAIDREALAGESRPRQVGVATAWRANFKGAPIPYQPDAAAAALESLGLRGHRLKLHTAKVKVKDNLQARMAARLAADFTRAGLEVEIVEHAETGPLFNKRDFEGLLFLGRDTENPSRFLNVPLVAGYYAVERPHGAHFDPPMVNA